MARRVDPVSVYGYIRVSTLDQTEGTSLSEQQRRIQGVAMAQGLILDRIYSDPGVSGVRPLALRDGGGELCDALQAGDTVIALKVDRLFRDSSDALAVTRAWRDIGVKLILADIGAVSENGVGRLFFTLLAAFAEWERELIRERLASGRQAKRQSGGHLGGRRPYGYRVRGKGKDAKLVPDANEQAAIATMLEWHRAGMGVRQISRELKARLNIRASHNIVTRVIKTNGEQDARRDDRAGPHDAGADHPIQGRPPNLCDGGLERQAGPVADRVLAGIGEG